MQAFFCLCINKIMGAAYINNNRELIRQYQKIYREKNKEKQKMYQKEYRKKNKIKKSNDECKKMSDEYKKLRNESIRKKYASDSNYRLTRIIRSMVSRTCKTLNVIKSNKSLKYIGCTPAELKCYIESKFKPGMTWDNHGIDGWHLDHIKPISKFTPEEVYNANHYTNLQPLWAYENLSKGNSY